MRARALMDAPIDGVRLFALRELVDHQDMLPTVDGTVFMASPVSYSIFCAMRDLHEEGEMVTMPGVLNSLLRYTVTTFDEIDLIVCGNMYYRAVELLFSAPHVDRPIYCAALSERMYTSEGRYAA